MINLNVWISSITIIFCVWIIIYLLEKKLDRIFNQTLNEIKRELDKYNE